jgi:hypothetical protein
MLGKVRKIECISNFTLARKEMCHFTVHLMQAPITPLQPMPINRRLLRFGFENWGRGSLYAMNTKFMIDM